MSNITNFNVAALINLSDSSAEVTNIEIDTTALEKCIYIRKIAPSMTCPVCGKRMYSKGIRLKRINHPIMQDGYKIILVLEVHKWFCPNDHTYDHDHYSFVEDRKQNTSLVPLMVMDLMRDLSLTARQVAKRLNISDTYVHETFMQYVSAPRLPFTSVISIDEVYMHFNNHDLYAMVIMDFHTGQIIDILQNRLNKTTEDYFLSIPREERKKVKYIISDMYKSYIGFANKYFPNAVPIVDSFHVISLITSAITRYVNSVKRRYAERDAKKLKEKNYENNSAYKTTKKSREVYLLDKYAYFLTKNQAEINYAPYWKRTRSGQKFIDPDAIEKEFMSLDKNFMTIRELKEKYIVFNNDHVNDYAGAKEDLDQIIREYSDSSLAMFKDIAETLEKYKDPIINSFTYIRDERHTNKEAVLRRLSNGPMEGFNVLPKSLKRNSRGVTNFEYTRARILWATREDIRIRAVPRAPEEVRTKTGKVRGPYKHKN